MIPESPPMVWLLYALGCGPEARPVDSDGHDPVEADEVCNGLDDDRDGLVDEDAADAPTWYADGDADGVGVEDTTIAACEAPPGYAAQAGDCDDTSPTISPLVDDAGLACGDGVEDCSRRPCNWRGRVELERAASASWQGVEPEDRVGRWSARLGDIDGDGIDDFAVDRFIFTSFETGAQLAGEGSTHSIELDATLNQVRGAGTGSMNASARAVVQGSTPAKAPSTPPSPGRIRANRRSSIQKRQRRAPSAS